MATPIAMTLPGIMPDMSGMLRSPFGRPADLNPLKGVPSWFGDEGSTLFRWTREALDAARHPHATLQAIEGALRKRRLRAKAAAAARATAHYAAHAFQTAVHAAGVPLHLYERWDELKDEKYPQKGNAVEKAAWDASHLYDAFENAVDLPGKIAKFKKLPRTIRQYARAAKTFVKTPQARKLVLSALPWLKHVVHAPFIKARRALRGHPWLRKALHWGASFGDKWSDKLEKFSDKVTKYLGPLRIVSDIHKTWTDANAPAKATVYDQAKKWFGVAKDVWDIGSDTVHTAVQWKKTKVASWLFNKTAPGRWLKHQGTWLKNQGTKLLETRIKPWARETLAPWIEKTAVPWIERKALPWAERALVPLAARLGVWGLAAAAVAGAAYGGYWLYTHPKERAALIRNTGDFFHNVAADLRGDPKAQKGWHPWADFAASSLKVAGDLSTFNVSNALKDASAGRHAAAKILGFEQRPGAKGPPMTLAKLGANAFKFVWDDVVPLVDGGLSHAIVDGAVSTWNWLRKPAQAPRPHASAHPARLTSHVQAPPARLKSHVQAPAVRITQPRRPRAANLPTKTEAEIRVQFNTLPSAASIGASKTASAFQFETGAQFAF
jgi:hypothetical protein